MLADLIQHDRRTDGRLRSFVCNFLSVIEFDAGRKGLLVHEKELDSYSACLGTAVMDGIQYFIGNGHPYPMTPDRCMAVIGAHLTHMLRDMLEDISVGFINIPCEILEAKGIQGKGIDSKEFRDWVCEQVELARYFFREGKEYIDSLDGLRCKLAGYWYCARFERVLDIIEQDGYQLRSEYHERRKLVTWGRMAWLGLAVTLKHSARRAWEEMSPRCKPQLKLGSEVNLRSPG